MQTMQQPRITSPALSVPGALDALLALSNVATDAASNAGLPRSTVELVHQRVSQINHCAVCIDLACRTAKKHGEALDDRLATLPAWRETAYFDDAERAALALAEAATRLADRDDPVPDEVWNEAAKHYDEPALAALVLNIALTNTWNRLNVTARQVAGEWLDQWVP
jgi:AhpD family alkylhydroperoxidase